MTRASIMTPVIDGKAIAATIRASVAKSVSILRCQHHIHVGLAVVMVGDHPASAVYVKNKVTATENVGMVSMHHHLPSTTTQNDLLGLIATLNTDTHVHGILVQLPLPAHIDEMAVIEAIVPEKDVDGFHPVNMGRLMIGLPSLVPCTPQGCMILIKTVLSSLQGKRALMVGRSNIVGKPLAMLLLQEHCTVTIAHSRTIDLEKAVAEADIVVAAVGVPELIQGDWIKPGAIVIDVGMNRVLAVETSEGAHTQATRLVGDVAFDDASQRAAAITPVPGGVGPMTIACLLRNTVRAACLQHGVDTRLVME